MMLDPMTGTGDAVAGEFGDTAVCLSDPPFGGRKGAKDDLAERIFHLSRDYWVPYDTATTVLGRMWALFRSPRCRRSPCALIVGDPNNGKTMIALQFYREVLKAMPPKPRRTEVPVVFVQTPADGDLNTLFGLMLRELGAPFIDASRPSKKYIQINRILEFTGTRMLILDEFHNIVECNRFRQKLFLNTLKQLSNELGIPIVLIGTHQALRVIETDQQLGSRFEPIAIPRWQPNDAYVKFVHRLVVGMDLKPGETLKKKVSVNKLHAMSEGLAGETKRILAKAGENALRNGKETLDMKALDAIEWTPPSERRKSAEKL